MSKHRVQTKPKARVKRARKKRKKIHKTSSSRIKTTRRTIKSKGKVISQRGRETWAQAPAIGMPQQAQNVWMESTVIDEYKYNRKEGTLTIHFQSGHVYIYFEVPEYTVITLGNAPSKGHYFYYNIRTSYTFQRIR